MPDPTVEAMTASAMAHHQAPLILPDPRVARATRRRPAADVVAVDADDPSAGSNDEPDGGSTTLAADGQLGFAPPRDAGTLGSVAPPRRRRTDRLSSLPGGHGGHGDHGGSAVG